MFIYNYDGMAHLTLWVVIHVLLWQLSGQRLIDLWVACCHTEYSKSKQDVKISKSIQD